MIYIIPFLIAFPTFPCHNNSTKNYTKGDVITMDIANVSSALNTVSSYDIGTSVSGTSLTEQVGIAMLDMSMELNAQLNASMIQALERSVTPHLGGNIDL